jgi:hypothetical protein
VRRLLLTAKSDTGKSSVIDEPTARGYEAIDTDSDAWSQWVESQDASGAVERDWVWRKDRGATLETDTCQARDQVVESILRLVTPEEDLQTQQLA